MRKPLLFFQISANAQALGDLQALRDNGRRTLRVNLGSDAEAGLKTMLAALPPLT